MSDSNRIKINSLAFSDHIPNHVDHVLKGLPRKKFGFIVAAPNVGKSFSCLTIAYEVATGLPLFGVTGYGTPQKVLYWPCEDGIQESLKRIEINYSGFTQSTIQILESNFELYDSEQPICSPSGIDNVELHKLITDAKEFDLVIIDTIREASGACDEVKDDRIIKLALQTLAKEADVSVLCTHHLTKEAARGNERITNVSASGLSETLANSRYQLFLNKTHSKSESQEVYSLSHIKDNFVSKEDKIKNQQVTWSDYDLPYSNEAALNMLCAPNKSEDFYPPNPITRKAPVENPRSQPTKNLEEPKTVDMSTVKVSKESVEEARKYKEETDIFTDERKERLRKFRQKQSY